MDAVLQEEEEQEDGVYDYGSRGRGRCMQRHLHGVFDLETSYWEEGF